MNPTQNQTHKKNNPSKHAQAWAFLQSLVFACFLTSLFYATLATATTDTHHNQLTNNASPYLALHATDPIHWQTWQADTLATAQKEHKLIFISSGYFSCHWCHVMQAENFIKPAVAKLLNQHFISIKVDRELSPDLDQYLVRFAQTTTGRAGWPQHLLLTPKGYPFYAFTFVKEPALLSILSKSIAFWEEEPQKISRLAKQQTQQLTPKQPTPSAFNAKQAWQKFQTQITATADTFSGGLNSTTKFPNAPILLSIIQPPHQQNTPANQAWLNTTLKAMQSPHNHLYDHVNGGFYRYTINPDWQTPHFEKMLYTQALLSKLYLIAAQKQHNSHFAKIALETLQYAEKHLYNPTTQLFMSSQSANNAQKIEGGDYLFTKAELKKRLTAQQYQQVKKEWHLTQTPPYETGWHPTPTQKYWPQIKQALQAKNIPTDTKSLLGWNGLMLSAYAQALHNHSTPHLQKIAHTLAQQLLKQLSQPHPPRALSATGQPMGTANIQDYAYIIQGLKDWQTVSSAPKKITPQINQLEKQAKTKFQTPSGWHYGEGQLLPGQVGEWAMPDKALPSPTANLDCQKPQQTSPAATLITASPIHYASYLNCQQPTHLK